MTFQAVAFVNGLSYGAEDVRHLSYLASAGQTGVATASSLQVAPTSTPSTNVVVNAGVATVVGNGLVESYIVTNDQAVLLPVPANNSSSTVTRQIVFAIRDPQMAGMPALSGVDDIGGDLLVVGGNSLPTDRPYIWLASVTMPPNTATVTASMLTNRRTLPLPRTYSRTGSSFPTAVTPVSTAYTQLGNVNIPFFVPSGMTHANIIVSVEGLAKTTSDLVRMAVTPTINGNRASMSQEVWITRSGPAQQTGFTAVGSFKLDPAWVGTTVNVGVRGRIEVGSTGDYQLDATSSIAASVEFYEDVE